MPERSSIAQGIQLGVETVEGVAVPATKRLSSLSVMPRPNMEFSAFAPMGNKLDTLSIMNREWSTADLDGRPTYTEIIYPLSSVFGAATITTPAGATNARQWEFILNPRSADVPVSLTVETGDGFLAERVAGLIFNSLTVGFSRTGDPELSGDAFGRKYTTGVQLSGNEVQTATITGGPAGGTFTLTFSGQATTAIAYNATAAAVQAALIALSNIADGEVSVTGGPGPATPYVIEFRGTLGRADVAALTAAHAFTGGTTPNIAITTTTPGVVPTAIELVPIMPGEVSVYVDAPGATPETALGVTKLTRAWNVSWAITDRFGQFWALDAAQPSFAATLELKPGASMELGVMADSAGMAFMDVGRQGLTRMVRIEAVSPTLIDAGVATSAYRMTVDIAMKISEVGNRDDQDGALVIPYTGTIVDEPLWSVGGIRVRVVNSLLAL